MPDLERYGVRDRGWPPSELVVRDAFEHLEEPLMSCPEPILDGLDEQITHIDHPLV
jgi:hypothetical protein